MEFEMNISCLDVPDMFFSQIPNEQLPNQLNDLKQMFQNSENYQMLLNKSTTNKVSDRSLISLVITVCYELDSQFSYGIVDGKTTRFLEYIDEDISQTEYLSRNRYICKIEGMDNPKFPSLFNGERQTSMKKQSFESDEKNAKIDDLICVMSFEDGVELKVGQRYHVIGIYQSSRFDSDQELDIKIPTNQRLFVLLWRKYGLVESCLDANGVLPEMNILLDKEDKRNTTIAPFAQFEIRKRILELMNYLIPEPMNVHLLLNILSSIRSRDPMILPRHTLCLTVDKVHPFVDELKELLYYFNPFVKVVNACQQKPLLPIITAETEEYEYHQLQVGNESIIIVEAEEEMNEINKEIVIQLIEQIQLQYIMYYHPIQIPINASVIFVTSKNHNKSISQICDQSLVIHNGIKNGSMNDLLKTINEKEMNAMRHYIIHCRNSKCHLKDDLQNLISESYAKARQSNPDINQMVLHAWLNMADLLGCSYGMKEITPELWNEMLQLYMMNN